MPAAQDPLGRLLAAAVEERDRCVPLTPRLRTTGAVTTAVTAAATAFALASATPLAAPRWTTWSWSWAGPARELVARLATYDGHLLLAGCVLAGLATSGVVTGVLTAGWRRAPAWRHFAVPVEACLAVVVLLPPLLAVVVLLVELVVVLVVGALVVAAGVVLLIGLMTGS